MSTKTRLSLSVQTDNAFDEPQKSSLAFRSVFTAQLVNYVMLRKNVKC